MSARPQATAHAPCPHRLYREIHGVPMEMCGAIGAEEIGDLPCEYCHEARDWANWKQNRKEAGQ